MKKVIIWIVVVVLVLAALAGAAIGAAVWGRSRQAQAHILYENLLSNLEQTALTVAEGEETVGVYDLETLGMLETAKTAAKECFSYEERLSAEEFANLPIWKQWLFKTLEADRTVTLDADELDPTRIYIDLLECEREASVDAMAQWEAEGYVLVPEVYGTELDFDVVIPQLMETVSKWAVKPDAVEQRTFDVAALDAYLLPQVTAEDEFDYKTMLQKATDGLVLPVKLLTETVELPLQALVSVDEEGKSTVDTEALSQLVDEWVEKCPEGTVDFVLDSYERGPVTLDFLQVTYELDKEALLEQLIEKVSLLDATELKVPYIVKRNGEVYELGDTYVEVDITRQKMTFFHEGEVVAYTDVVTGLPWGYWTWPGLYAVQNKDTDCQLTAPDYSVHVDYWVGYDGLYGIHDAEWRENFGGKFYETNGSHGCVNTPTDAMAAIFEKIEVGVPVIVHAVEIETEEAEQTPAENA